jgi:protease-4
MPWWDAPRPRRKGRGLLIGVLIVLLVMSVLVNLYLMAAVGSHLDQSFDRDVIRGGDETQTVSVYAVRGVIDDNAAAKFSAFCRSVRKDANVRAVVLRVDSPGGSVSASDQMAEDVRRLQTEGGKKVVVSMGGLAASGGYYISAGADRIVAEPTTITGSVGVIMGWVVLKGTMEKIGMEPMILKSTHAQAWKDELSSFKMPSDRQREHLQGVLDEMQARFESVVKVGRGDRLHPHETTYTVRTGEGEQARDVQMKEIEPFNGKIYMAGDALRLGLVDVIGYREKAYDIAAEMAGLNNPRVVQYTQRRSFFQAIMDGESKIDLPLSSRSLDELQTPRVMMIWKAE